MMQRTVELLAKPESPDVIIVGAGPVGLWTAIHLQAYYLALTKTQFPNFAEVQSPALNILMLEQYPEYQRTHTVRLDLANINDQELVDRIIGVVSSELSPEDKEKVRGSNIVKISVPTLEECMLAYAKEKGINIQYQKVEHYQDIKAAYPDCDIVIGADGRKSTLRKTAFGADEEVLDEHQMQYMVEFSYDVTEKTKALPWYGSFYRTEKIMNFFCTEQIKDNKVIVRFFVNKQTYDELGTATKKEPRLLSRDLPKKLRHDINLWLNVRQQETGESHIQGSARITKSILSTYKSRLISQDEGGKLLFLVGDAVFGVPYFRSLNAGLRGASHLAESIAMRFRGSLKHTKLVTSYESYIQNLYRKEALTAYLKNISIGLSNMKLASSGAALWQINSWSQAQKDQFNQDHPAFGSPEMGYGQFVNRTLFNRYKKNLFGLAVATVFTLAMVFTLGAASLGIGPIIGLVVAGLVVGSFAAYLFEKGCDACSVVEIEGPDEPPSLGPQSSHVQNGLLRTMTQQAQLTQQTEKQPNAQLMNDTVASKGEQIHSASSDNVDADHHPSVFGLGL